jgi:hypothetical protein
MSARVDAVQLALHSAMAARASSPARLSSPSLLRARASKRRTVP